MQINCSRDDSLALKDAASGRDIQHLSRSAHRGWLPSVLVNESRLSFDFHLPLPVQCCCSSFVSHRHTVLYIRPPTPTAVTGIVFRSKSRGAVGHTKISHQILDRSNSMIEALSGTSSCTPLHATYVALFLWSCNCERHEGKKVTGAR